VRAGASEREKRRRSASAETKQASENAGERNAAEDQNCANNFDHRSVVSCIRWRRKRGKERKREEGRGNLCFPSKVVCAPQERPLRHSGGQKEKFIWSPWQHSPLLLADCLYLETGIDADRSGKRAIGRSESKADCPIADIAMRRILLLLSKKASILRNV
jgi:hypothetical protein